MVEDLNTLYYLWNTTVSQRPGGHWACPSPSSAAASPSSKSALAMIRHAPRMVTDDLLALRHAAVAGIGIVHLPSVVVRDEIAAGQLVELVPGWAPKSGVIHAIFPSRRGLLPSVRTLIDFLGEEFSRSDIA